jgi:NAD(P)-dependent dehydrogenase (short-subunit alcohol dehydrogenase family)
VYDTHNFVKYFNMTNLPVEPRRVALISGAARGIGLATTKQFLAEGWSVAMLDIEVELLQSTVDGLCEPERTLALVCDVSDPAQVTATFAKVEKHFGRLESRLPRCDSTQSLRARGRAR